MKSTRTPFECNISTIGKISSHETGSSQPTLLVAGKSGGRDYTVILRFPRHCIVLAAVKATGASDPPSRGGFHPIFSRAPPLMEDDGIGREKNQNFENKKKNREGEDPRERRRRESTWRGQITGRY